MKVAISILVLGLATIAMAATLGMDVSQPTSQKTFACFVASGYTFAGIRAYKSNGAVDTNAAQSVANAQAANMPEVDLYMFPCPKCSKSATEQVEEMYTYLNENQVIYNRMWLDIEDMKYWDTDQTKNREFFDELVEACVNKGLVIGVYTSVSQWQPIMGRSWAHGGELPLWYARYDGKQNFDDFQPFGGWTYPTIKQFQGDTKQCGQNVDLNWSGTDY